MKRIRYKEYGTVLIASVDGYSVTLTGDLSAGFTADITRDEFHERLTESTLPALKKYVKNFLEGAGVVFEKETRNRKKSTEEIFVTHEELHS